MWFKKNQRWFNLCCIDLLLKFEYKNNNNRNLQNQENEVNYNSKEDKEEYNVEVKDVAEVEWNKRSKQLNDGK